MKFADALKISKTALALNHSHESLVRAGACRLCSDGKEIRVFDNDHCYAFAPDPSLIFSEIDPLELEEQKKYNDWEPLF